MAELLWSGPLTSFRVQAFNRFVEIGEPCCPAAILPLSLELFLNFSCLC